MTNNTNPSLPRKFLDPHQHFTDTATNASTFNKFLSKLVPDVSYLAKDYFFDVIDPLQKAGVEFIGSVNVECLPDDGVSEVEWVKSDSSSAVVGIVASCDLAQGAIVEKELEKLSGISHVKG